MERRLNATYVTKWNGGKTMVKMPCIIDIIERKVLYVSSEKKITSPYDNERDAFGYDVCEGVYVIMPDGTEYPVVGNSSFSGYADYDGKKVVPFIYEPKFDVVLIEKEGVCGLTKEDVESIYDALSAPEAYPIEIDNLGGESSAQGFISSEAAEKIEYDYVGSGLFPFIGGILADVNQESEDGTYEFKGLTIFLTR